MEILLIAIQLMLAKFLFCYLVDIGCNLTLYSLYFFYVPIPLNVSLKASAFKVMGGHCLKEIDFDELHIKNNSLIRKYLHFRDCPTLSTFDLLRLGPCTTTNNSFLLRNTKSFYY